MMTNNIPANPSQELGMLKMPIQQWTSLYNLHAGLKAGTIFPELDKPFYLGGGIVDR